MNTNAPALPDISMDKKKPYAPCQGQISVHPCNFM